MMLTATILAGMVAAATFNVQTYGAKGDGATKDTAAIQSAIDAASAAGGGTVEFAPGVYLTGSIWLKDNVDVRLDGGTFAPVEISAAERTKIEEDIVKNRNLLH